MIQVTGLKTKTNYFIHHEDVSCFFESSEDEIKCTLIYLRESANGPAKIFQVKETPLEVFDMLELAKCR